MYEGESGTYVQLIPNLDLNLGEKAWRLKKGNVDMISICKLSMTRG